MTRNALYLSIVAVVLAFCLGWGSGVVLSTRLNTLAIQSYVDAHDFERDAVHRDALAQAQLHYTLLLADHDRANADALGKATVAYVRDQAKADRLHAVALAECQSEVAGHLKANQDLARAYSERVLGLQEQLHAHGIAERIVPVGVTK